MASKASIDKARGKILQAGADTYAFNPDPQDLKQIASDAGYSGIEGKAFRTAITKLKEEGFLTRSKNIITWTAKGIATFPKAKDPPTPEERQAKFFETLCKNPEKLPGGLPSDDKFKIIFDLLLDGKSHTKKELAEAVEYSVETKKFRNAMKRLEAVKMIDSATGKSIQMKEGLFGPGPAAAATAAAPAAKSEELEEPPKKKAKVDTNSAKKQSSKKKAADVNKETSTSEKDDESNGDIDNENESEVSKKEDEDTPEEKESADEPSSKEKKQEKNANENVEDGINDSDEDYSASEGEGEESEWEE